MSHRSGLSSPFHSPHPRPDPDGDKRDIHDVNPSTNLNVAHERAADDPANVFKEGVPGIGSRIGRTADVVPDILSTAMGGQRRSATGEYESEPSIHKTQDNEHRETEERMKAAPLPWPRHIEGRE